MKNNDVVEGFVRGHDYGSIHDDVLTEMLFGRKVVAFDSTDDHIFLDLDNGDEIVFRTDNILSYVENQSFGAVSLVDREIYDVNVDGDSIGNVTVHVVFENGDSMKFLEVESTIDPIDYECLYDEDLFDHDDIATGFTFSMSE